MNYIVHQILAVPRKAHDSNENSLQRLGDWAILLDVKTSLFHKTYDNKDSVTSCYINTSYGQANYYESSHQNIEGRVFILLVDAC